MLVEPSVDPLGTEIYAKADDISKGNEAGLAARELEDDLLLSSFDVNWGSSRLACQVDVTPETDGMEVLWTIGTAAGLAGWPVAGWSRGKLERERRGSIPEFSEKSLSLRRRGVPACVRRRRTDGGREHSGRGVAKVDYLRVPCETSTRHGARRFA